MATPDDLTRSVATRSYKSESDERLRELIAAAVDVHGRNPIAMHQITHAAEILRDELAMRGLARKEKVDEERHRQIGIRLDELKRPHWSVTPNFWMTFAILILTAIGAAAAVLALVR